MACNIPFVLAVSVAANTSFPAGVLATITMGITNPLKPTTGTPINQTSYSRLLSVNSIDVHKKTPLLDCKKSLTSLNRTFVPLLPPCGITYQIQKISSPIY